MNFNLDQLLLTKLIKTENKHPKITDNIKKRLSSQQLTWYFMKGEVY